MQLIINTKALNIFHQKNFFFPYHLDLQNDKRRNVAAESMYNFFKGIVEVSNSNFIRNVNHLLATLSKTNNEIVCLGENNRRFNSTKFKLTCQFSLEQMTKNHGTTYDIWFLLLNCLSLFDLLNVRFVDKEILKLFKKDKRYKQFIWYTKNTITSQEIQQ